MSKTKDVAEAVDKDTGEITEYNPAMFEEDQGVGSTEMGVEDMALPFLKALHSKNDNKLMKTLPGAESGDILNTATMEVYKGGITVVPCVYQRRFIHWSPRGEGTGAPIHIYTPDEPMPKTERDETDNKEYVVDHDGHRVDGTYIEETHQHFVLIVTPEGGVSHALIAMKSTQLKKSRKWNSTVGSRVMKGNNGSFTPPRYAYTYKLNTMEEDNNKGEWSGWVITLDGPITDRRLYQKAKDFYESVTHGDVVVKHEDADGKAAPEEEVKEDNIPF